MKLVVIESPYAGHIEANTGYAKAAMRDSLDRGEAPTASHILYAHSGVLDESKKRERSRGITAGYSWMKQADIVVFYMDLGFSNGMRQALRHALNLDKEIEFRYIFATTDAKDINYSPEVIEKLASFYRVATGKDPKDLV